MTYDGKNIYSSIALLQAIAVQNLASAMDRSNAAHVSSLSHYAGMNNVYSCSNTYPFWNNINALTSQYVEKPKSGRKAWKDIPGGWIVIAFESGPLKLLELELK